MMRSCFAFLFALATFNVDGSDRWTLMAHFKEHTLAVMSFPEHVRVPIRTTATVGGINILVELTPHKGYTSFRVTATTTEATEVFLSLQRVYSSGVPYNFNGPVQSAEIFRQSPHDIDAWIVTTIALQAVPVVAVSTKRGFEVAVCGSPYLYDNFTSQAFFTDEKKVVLRSGDDGATPGLKMPDAQELVLDYNADKSQRFTPGRVLSHYHTIGEGKPHVFEGLIFSASGNTVNSLRRDVNRFVADYFSKGRFTDYFGALSYATAFMNLRRNETGRSSAWVVPAVEYANRQYGRDAFWISMMLPPALSAECLRNELAVVDEFAEYPLYVILWAYRLHRHGIPVELDKVQAYVNAVERRVRDGAYYSYLESDGRLDFQYWGDLMAFEKDDVITYNQGLLAVAISAAQAMGLKIETDPELAVRKYQEMFNEQYGVFPVSEKKSAVMSPDPLIGDLLSIMLFDRSLLKREQVNSHFQRLVSRSRTRYGFKVVSSVHGEYLRPEDYDVEGYKSQMNKEKVSDGTYYRGGSYFLYDNLFLLDAWLHGITEAGALLEWRTALDFSIGNTTYETLNTVTGEPWKPNMGWNVAIYAICIELIDKGKLSPNFLQRIDKVSRGAR